MSPLFLIHGFGIGLTSLPFCRAYGPNCGFEAFEPDLQTKQATAFRWAIERTMSLSETFNPFTQLAFYQQEKQLTRDAQIHTKLHQALQSAQPKTILCHSLGSDLFLNYAQHHDLPPSVQTIIFVQADIPHRPTQFSKQLQTLLSNKTIQLHNYYCPYDQALLTTVILSAYLPAGLLGLRHPNVQNHFFPLSGRINLHASSICNPHFRDAILKL